MQEFIKRDGGAFAPDVVNLLCRAFEDAWAILRSADGITPQDIQERRDELGLVTYLGDAQRDFKRFPVYVCSSCNALKRGNPD
jgi:hypothetical protein